ncbi:uncharacterized protein A1O9_02771 [Exophiala aquamarina CBS 119918]|uniref:AB hydrolase-1 domain-containing protein n=1 Tax=Exophiala aquamarina CBS 119918 TaxID=1182545 RepID=A0A072PMW3_9EURO|nr:uncharacterized protein A1O9_02771 [Exophiala aquamarina CBS 119918]KEF61206.1 hypothetical protein A1O9_02771 [Exophiala aquamarina CBS 119918]
MAPPSQPKPAIVVIPGSACPTPFYADLVANLTAHGYEAQVHNLRTYTANPTAETVPGSLADDAEYFHGKIAALADAGKDVVVVAHSYGGLVATDAVHGLSKAERGGKAGGVVRIIYLSCIVGAVGSTSAETCAPSLPKFDFMEPVDESGAFMRQIPAQSAPLVYSDMPLAQGLEWVSQMWPQATRSFTDKIQHAGYLHSPVTYILCTKDEVLLPGFQRERIEFIEKETGKKVDVVELEVGHCPNVSAPDLTASTVVDAIVRDA